MHSVVAQRTTCAHLRSVGGVLSTCQLQRNSLLQQLHYDKYKKYLQDQKDRKKTDEE